METPSPEAAPDSPLSKSGPTCKGAVLAYGVKRSYEWNNSGSYGLNDTYIMC